MFAVEGRGVRQYDAHAETNLPVVLGPEAFPSGSGFTG
jgi:hypothetical protein